MDRKQFLKSLVGIAVGIKAIDSIAKEPNKPIVLKTRWHKDDPYMNMIGAPSHMFYDRKLKGIVPELKKLQKLRNLQRSDALFYKGDKW